MADMVGPRSIIVKRQPSFEPVIATADKGRMVSFDLDIGLADQITDPRDIAREYGAVLGWRFE